MVKAKMVIAGISIPVDKVARTGGAGAGTLGHSFPLSATLRVIKRTMGALSGDGIDYPELEWKETIEWFAYDGASKAWTYVGKNEKDMYDQNPNSHTFAVWHTAKFMIATDPSNHPPPALVAAVDKFHSTEDRDKAAKHWIAENGFEWSIAITDRPAIGLAGGSGGGGGESLVQSNSRRRVIYFDLGFHGSPTRVSATQILESIQGRPTIQRFFIPAISKAIADDPTNLARWRSQFGQPETFRP